MAQDLKAKLAKQETDAIRIGRDWALGGPPPAGFESWEERAALQGDRLARTIAKMSGYTPPPNGGNGGDPTYRPVYSKEIRDKVFAQPQYNEYEIQWLSLVGFLYRFLDTQPKYAIDTVYEVARITRDSGGSILRTMMINGSRKKGEKYIFDALPWKMVKPENLWLIDFDQRNDYYFQCCAVIEDACKYWRLKHRPSLTLDRYNYDIFDWDYNVQRIDGYRSPEALEVKKKWFVDYIEFQMTFRGANYKPVLEFENEPAHNRNHWLGKEIADEHLALFRAVEHLVRIDECMTCSKGSEFAHAHFVGPESFTMPDGSTVIFGSLEFKDRRVWPEYHGCSTKLGLDQTGWADGVSSGWHHLANNGDGGSPDGEFIPLPWAPGLRFGTYDQVKEMCLYAMTTAGARGKPWRYTEFVPDVLLIDPADGIPKETYDLEHVDTRRLKAYPDARAQYEDSL